MITKPTKYDTETFSKKLDEYLDLRKDKIEPVVDGSKKPILLFKVNLPTIEGFASFLGIARRTIFNWQEIHEEVKDGLERIKQEQLQRLIDEGLAGNYNSTIAKLILSANHGMGEEINTNISGEVTNKFDEQQIDRIAERIAARSRANGDISG